MTASASVNSLSIDLHAEQHRAERRRRSRDGWRAFVVAVVVAVVLDAVAFIVEDPQQLVLFALRTAGRVAVAAACWRFADDEAISIPRRRTLRTAAVAWVLTWCAVWPLLEPRSPVSALLLHGTVFAVVDAVVVVVVAGSIETVRGAARGRTTALLTTFVVVAMVIGWCFHANNEAGRALYRPHTWVSWDYEAEGRPVPFDEELGWAAWRGLHLLLVWAPLLTCAVAAVRRARRHEGDGDGDDG